MHKVNPFSFAVFLMAGLIAAASAQIVTEPPTEKEAVNIISTYDDINSSLYKIIHIKPGRQLEENGFISDNVVRITAFAPESASRPKRGLRQYVMQYTVEYGWYLETTKEDTRGIYLEISSQKKGRVFVR